MSVSKIFRPNQVLFTNCSRTGNPILLYTTLVSFATSSEKVQVPEIMRELGDEINRMPGLEVTMNDRGQSEVKYGSDLLARFYDSGELEARFNWRKKGKLLQDGCVSNHPQMPFSGWITFKIKEKSDYLYARYLIRFAYREQLKKSTRE